MVGKRICTLFLALTVLLAMAGCHTESEEKNPDDDLVTVFLASEYTSNSSKNTFKYDKFGNVIQECYYSDGNMISIYEYEYQYDDAGNVIKKTYIDGEKTNCDEYEYQYDEAGNVIKEIYLDSNEGRYYEYAFDNEGNKISEVCYSNGEELNCYQYLYDSNGNMVRKSEYADGEEISYTDFKYNEEKLVQEVSNDIFGEGRRIEYEYDFNGKIKNLVIYHGGTNPKEYEFSYDANGNITCEITWVRGTYQVKYQEYRVTKQQAEKLKNRAQEEEIYCAYLTAIVVE